MRVFLLREQRAALAEESDDLGVGVEDILADARRHADVLGEFTEVIHGREHGQAVLLAGDVVVLAVSGSDVDLAGAGIHRDEVRTDDSRFAREKRMLRFDAKILDQKMSRANSRIRVSV